MTPDDSNRMNPQPYTGSDQVAIANGSTLPLYSVGDLHISTPSSFKLKDALYVPNLNANLLSVSRFVHDNNCVISFDYEGFSIKDRRTGRILHHSQSRDSLFSLQAQ